VTPRKRQTRTTLRVKPEAQTGVERQKRYRAGKAIRSIDLPEEVLVRIRALRTSTGLPTAILLTRCLDAFDATTGATAETKRSSKGARGIKTPPAQVQAGPEQREHASPGDGIHNAVSGRKGSRLPKNQPTAALKPVKERAGQIKTGEDLRPGRPKAGKLSKKSNKPADGQFVLFPPGSSDPDDQA
jgi:hypothetical protein